MGAKASSDAYFSCLAPDEFVRLCLLRLLLCFLGTLLVHLVTQFDKFPLFFFLGKRLDLQHSVKKGEDHNAKENAHAPPR
jgi:hypothetical protein